MMYDGDTDLYYDGNSTADAGDGEYIPFADDVSDNDNDAGDSDISDIIRDVLENYFGNADGNGAEGEKEEEKDGDETTEGDETETGEVSETDGVESEASDQEDIFFDAEVLNEIRDILKCHADSADSFMSGLTVSGNVIEVSLDDGSSALISDISAKQVETLDRLDGMTGLIFLVFFVLVFDLLHRFAKRIIKNLTGGEKNGANS